MLTVVLILFAANGIISTEAVSCCPDGWISFNTSCYLFPDTAPVHFTEAEHFCEQHGGHLVTIDNRLENGFLKTYLTHMKAPGTWIGMTDELIEGSWRWTLTKSQPSFTDWYPGQPDDWQGAEDCVRFSGLSWSYRWSDDTCSASHMPLCEQRKTETEAEIIG